MNWPLRREERKRNRKQQKLYTQQRLVGVAQAINTMLVANNNGHSLNHDQEQQELLRQQLQLQVILQRGQLANRGDWFPPQGEDMFAVTVWKWGDTFALMTIQLIPIEFDDDLKYIEFDDEQLVNPTTVYFGLNELPIMEFFLKEHGNGILYLHLEKCDTLELDEWRTLLGILKQSLPEDLLYLGFCPLEPGDAGLDDKLVLLSRDDYRFPKLKIISINFSKEAYGFPYLTATLPKFYKSIRHLQSLESIYLDPVTFQKYFLTLECLNNLATSIANLPNLKIFYIRDFIIPNNTEIEKGLEALFGAIASHRNLQFDIDGHLPRGIEQYTGNHPNRREFDREDLRDFREYQISPRHRVTTVPYILAQLKQQQGELPQGFPQNIRLPPNFPQNNRYTWKYDETDNVTDLEWRKLNDNQKLALWVEALITVKVDLQVKGKDRSLDVFHFLFAELVQILNYNTCSQEYWEASDPNIRLPFLYQPEQVAAIVCIQKQVRRYHNDKIDAAILIQSQIRGFIVQRCLQLHRDSIDSIQLGCQQEEELE